MEKFNYGVTCNEMFEHNENYSDSADWFDGLDAAMKAATILQSQGYNGVPATNIEIRSFNDCGDQWWDFPVTLEEDGTFWSNDPAARAEMGCIQ